jgi:hypothetical protein
VKNERWDRVEMESGRRKKKVEEEKERKDRVA